MLDLLLKEFTACMTKYLLLGSLLQELTAITWFTSARVYYCCLIHFCRSLQQSFPYESVFFVDRNEIMWNMASFSTICQANLWRPKNEKKTKQISCQDFFSSQARSIILPFSHIWSEWEFKFFTSDVLANLTYRVWSINSFIKQNNVRSRG